MEKITVLGAGSWGTALAVLLARSGQDVTLWVRRPGLAETLRSQRVNHDYLPGISIPENLLPVSDLAVALAGASWIVSAIPSHGVRAILTEARRSVESGAQIVSTTKGLETETLLRMSQVIAEVLSGRSIRGVAALSGPSFAIETAQGQPTAVVVASEDPQLAASAQRLFSTGAFRVYTNSDLVGVEVGGAVKNVIAIASGVLLGLGLGQNSLAALITRGLAEVGRLGVACGARPETFGGLAGLGDLVLTCTGQLSRNRSLGISIGQGLDLAAATSQTRMVAEGVLTTRATVALAEKLQVEMPITQQMYEVLYKGKSPTEGIASLLERKLKEEF
ncbi:MAG: NAD(P)H-dependent glycerol-3-phosphate dehydrogenase [Acidobacteriota bacterium]